MDKTIERKFFSFYEMGGFAFNCLEMVKIRHDLNSHGDRVWERLPQEIRGFYTNELPPIVGEQYKANARWIDEVLSGTYSPLTEEIVGNLKEYQTDTDRERDLYIFSLIEPFRKFAETFNPKADTKSRSGKAKKRDGGLSDGIREIIYCYAKEGSPEHILAVMHTNMEHYANRLCALLLERGFDLMKYQQKRGVYLCVQYDLATIANYVGGVEAAKEYYAALCNTSATPPQPSAGCSDQQPVEGIVPAELRTEKVEKVLSIIESVSVNVQGKGTKKAIDRSVFPWGYASRSSLRYIAGVIHDICKTESKWKPFENVTGKKNFMQGVNGRCDDVYYALQDAGYKVKQRY